MFDSGLRQDANKVLVVWLGTVCREDRSILAIYIVFQKRGMTHAALRLSTPKVEPGSKEALSARTRHSYMYSSLQLCMMTSVIGLKNCEEDYWLFSLKYESCIGNLHVQ